MAEQLTYNLDLDELIFAHKNKEYEMCIRDRT